MKITSCISSILIFFIAYTCFSQLKEGESIDKVIAIVGKEIIMKSEIDQSIAAIMQQNPNVNPNDKAFRDKILENLINDKLLITKANEDSIIVSDEEVSARFNELIGGMIRQYGSEKRVEDVLGKPISKVKADYSEIIRNKLLTETLIRTKFGQVSVNQREVKEFFDKYQDSMEKVPPKFSIYHIVRNIKPSSQSQEEAFNLAKKIRDSIVMGGNFADFAKRYSADPGSKEFGGELGWFESGKLIPEFEKAANGLQKGETSLPIQTPFGYHIIQTMDKKPNSLLTRHILIKIGQSTNDVDTVKQFLLSLKDRVERGESFLVLAKQYSDDKETKGFNGFLGKLSLGEMPGNMQTLVDKMKLGEVSEPMPFGSDPTKPGYHIIYKKDFIPEHKANLEDDYKIVEQMATIYKRQKLIMDLIADLRKQIYWEMK